MLGLLFPMVLFRSLLGGWRSAARRLPLFAVAIVASAIVVRAGGGRQLPVAIGAAVDLSLVTCAMVMISMIIRRVQATVAHDRVLAAAGTQLAAALGTDGILDVTAGATAQLLSALPHPTVTIAVPEEIATAGPDGQQRPDQQRILDLLPAADRAAVLAGRVVPVEPLPDHLAALLGGTPRRRRGVLDVHRRRHALRHAAGHRRTARSGGPARGHRDARAEYHAALALRNAELTARMTYRAFAAR